MKNLGYYVIESSMILEAEAESLWKQSKEASEIRYKLKNYFVSLKGKKYSLGNQTELRKIFKDFINTLTFGNYTSNLTAVKKYGIATESGFAKFILDNHDNFIENKFYIDWVKQWDESEIEKEYKKWKESNKYVASISDEDAEERDLVIYDRWNPEEHIVKPFRGKRGKSTDHEVNMIRMDFKHEFGVKYYDCYPILFKNYEGHIEELKKRAEYQLGYDDPNEFK